MSGEVYLLILGSDGLPPPGYILLHPPPFKLRVQSSQVGTLWIDLPPQGQSFSRNKFYKHSLSSASFAQSSYIELDVTLPGAFTAYLEFHGETGLKKTRKWHFTVQPALHAPISSLNILTVISKLMGSLPWDESLDNIRARGYNMIHFTPLQKRGLSNSPYSISSHLEFDPELFNSEDDVRNLTRSMASRGLLALTDIVWNHIAHSSPCLEDHPEIGYNLQNSPHLWPAYDLDEALLQFSKKSANIHKRMF